MGIAVGSVTLFMTPVGGAVVNLGTAIESTNVWIETKAFDMIDAKYIRDIEPGEIVTITKEGVESRHYGGGGTERGAACIFEQVYFADPSSIVFGDNVHLV
ncbi:hypothetical protein LCGC14_2111620, partial [marine sediment metagenome]